MGETPSRRAGEPGRRPEPVPRDGSPRRELAYWLRRTLADHGDPTLETLLRGMSDEARVSRSALGKALRGDTFPDLALVRSVLATAGAHPDRRGAWVGYWHYLDQLERLRRDGQPVAAQPPGWAGRDESGESPARGPAAGGDPAPPRSAPPARSSGRRPGRTVALVVASALAGAAIALGGQAATRSLAAPAAAGTVTATIITPNTTVVPRTFPLLGSYRNLPSGTMIWATTFDPGTRRYFPQDKPCVAQPDGAFDCGQYYLGAQDRPDTATYRIDILVVDPAAGSRFLQYQLDKGGPDGPDVGLPALPSGATTVASRAFTRD